MYLSPPVMGDGSGEQTESGHTGFPGRRYGKTLLRDIPAQPEWQGFSQSLFQDHSLHHSTTAPAKNSTVRCLTSLPMNFDHCANTITAMPDLFMKMIICTQWEPMTIQTYRLTNEQPADQELVWVNNAETLKETSSCQAYCLLECQVTGQGEMFLLWNSGTGAHHDSMSVK